MIALAVLHDAIPLINLPAVEMSGLSVKQLFSMAYKARLCQAAGSQEKYITYTIELAVLHH